ncbi:MAG: Gfo/Idh/MocA family oxidoreductase [bacterium]|nr:Gfo/Idh/MocA family oxidoreductase [bacterium]
MKIAVIGYGYWGPNLVRNFSWTPGVEVAYVCDLDPKQLAKVSAMFPNVGKTTTNYQEVLDDPSIEAVAISTPVQTHAPLAKMALLAGKHVLVEKPMTDSVASGEEIVKLAEEKGLVLMTDHTFLFTGAVRKIKELVDSGTLGKVYYFDSMRVNLGLFQSDVNVIWDLAPHDLSIMLRVIDKKPMAVAAHGVAHVEGHPENLAFVSVFFEDSTIAHFNVNWLSPVKVRQILIGGSEKMILFNDMENVEKIKIFDSGVNVQTREEVYKALISYRTGDVYSPKLENVEALRLECQHFVDCIQKGETPISDGHFGLEIVRMLAAAQESIEKGGVTIQLNR